MMGLLSAAALLGFVVLLFSMSYLLIKVANEEPATYSMTETENDIYEESLD